MLIFIAFAMIYAVAWYFTGRAVVSAIIMGIMSSMQ